MNWFGDVPKLVYETEFSCEKCGTKQQQVLEGLQNFFRISFFLLMRH